MQFMHEDGMAFGYRFYDHDMASYRVTHLDVVLISVEFTKCKYCLAGGECIAGPPVGDRASFCMGFDPEKIVVTATLGTEPSSCTTFAVRYGFGGWGGS